MSTTRVVREEPPGDGDGGWNRRWLIPAILALLILVVLAIAFFATHPHVFGRNGTATPTATPVVITATPLPKTATPKPGPTGTPRPGPTGTARPGPTATPKPTLTPTPAPTPTPTP